MIIEARQEAQMGCMASEKNMACFDKGYQQRSKEVEYILANLRKENAKLRDLLVEWYFEANP